MSNVIKVPYMPISDFEVPDELIAETDEVDDEDPIFKLDQGLISKNLLFVLHSMGMEKYKNLFKQQRVQLDTFLNLSERDLEELGITDAKDRAAIVKKLGTENQTNDSEFVVRENHVEDLQIVRNVHRQLVLLQNYCAYIELQMKKNKLTDFKVNPDELASLYLKSFTEAALLQSQILSKKIYDENSDDGLIDKILMKYNLVLPEVYQKVLPKKKRKGGSKVKKIVTVIGVSSLIIIIGRLLSSKR